MPCLLVIVAQVIAALASLIAADVERASDSGVAFPTGATAEVVSATRAGGEGPADACYGGPQNIRQRSGDGRSIEGVYRIDAPGKVSRVLGNDDVERANGVLVSADDRFLFVTDNCNDRRVRSE